jgi:hypothetical protein
LFQTPFAEFERIFEQTPPLLSRGFQTGKAIAGALWANRVQVKHRFLSYLEAMRRSTKTGLRENSL